MMLPIGFDNFGKVIEEKLDFIDKSLFIKDVFDDKSTAVAVITRPRRFGKTLNLSMLHHFLSSRVYGRETKDLFKHLDIAEHPSYMENQGKYPVVFVTFKDIKHASFKEAYEDLIELFVNTYEEHNYLLDSKKISDTRKYYYEKVLRGEINQAQVKNALKILTECLFKHHGVRPWLLIDEYDTPIQAGYVNGYYKGIINLMRGVFSGALKSNNYLEKAVITGILRVAKESLFSDVNNLEVYSLLRNEYAQYFGFTEEEVDNILKVSSLSGKSTEIKDWYNGYQVGQTVIYNPWSIANCVKRHGKLEPYWVNTSDNQLIKDLLKRSSLIFKRDFEFLVDGNTIEKLIDERMVFQYLNNNVDSVWSLLLMAGYLKPTSLRDTDQGIFAKLAIPNREVRNLYRQIVEQWLSNGYGIQWYNAFIESLLCGKIKEFKDHLDKVLLQIVSFHDSAKEPEAFFHGLLLGFIASLQASYEIKSNRESGLGRFDIMIIPKDKSKNEAGVIIELKIKNEDESLAEAAKRALLQIEQKKYGEEFNQRGIKKVIQIGVGFKGKECAVEGKGDLEEDITLKPGK